MEPRARQLRNYRSSSSIGGFNLNSTKSTLWWYGGFRHGPGQGLDAVAVSG